MLRRLITSFFLCQIALADSTSNAVNERIPVSSAALEAHWNIDCQSAWSTLETMVTEVASGGHCAIDRETRREIQLCAFVYQPPGEEQSRSCPDYRAALSLITEADAANRCAALARLLQTAQTCFTGDSPGRIP
ncbi:MAG: hypothetical protein H6984_00455 [Pseudomonadales bacterium]|nr:hypothetical protein [Halioglobus sp.]MCP5120903.1 hypothetical protein [Pseudomonadales bacterium]MCP5194345.1 hypothetical protein [Pseudomonadales bacterium]